MQFCWSEVQRSVATFSMLFIVRLKSRSPLGWGLLWRFRGKICFQVHSYDWQNWAAYGWRIEGWISLWALRGLSPILTMWLSPFLSHQWHINAVLCFESLLILPSETNEIKCSTLKELMWLDQVHLNYFPKLRSVVSCNITLEFKSLTFTVLRLRRVCRPRGRTFKEPT